MMNYKFKLKQLFLPALLITPLVVNFDGPRVSDDLFYESTFDLLATQQNSTPLNPISFSSFEVISTSEIFIQIGSDSSNNKYLRFSTAVHLPNGAGVDTLKYERTMEGKEKNTKSVTNVYRCIKGDGSTQYYYNEYEGLVSEESKASSNWYFACYTVKYSESSPYLDSTIKVDLIINNEKYNQVYGGGASASYNLLSDGAVSITYIGTEDEFFYKQMAEPGTSVTPVSYTTYSGFNASWYEDEIEYDFSNVEASTVLQAKTGADECLSHHGTHYNGLVETNNFNGYKDYNVCSDCGNRYLNSVSGEFDKTRVLSSASKKLIKISDPRFLLKNVENINATVFLNQDELSLSSSGFDESELPSNRRGGTYTDYYGQPFDIDSYTPGTVIEKLFTTIDGTTYSLNGLVVSSVIKTKQDFSTMITAADTTGVGLHGYYVLGNDISLGGTSGTGLTPEGLYGTFDGRNHSISNVYVWGNGIFGKVRSGSVIKDTNFTNIIWARVLAYDMEDAHISNCKFIMKDSGYLGNSKGLLACDCRGGVTFENNCLIDTRNNVQSTYDSSDFLLNSIADHDYAPTSKPINYYDLQVKSLAQVKPFISSNNGIYSPAVNYSFNYNEYFENVGLPFVQDGASDYKITYAQGTWFYEREAHLIQRNVKQLTGVTLPVESFVSGTSIDSSKKLIVLGPTSNCLAPVEQSKSGYILKTIDNSVFITSNGEDGVELGVNKFLEIVLGYDYLNYNLPIFKGDAKTLPILNYANDDAFELRKLDGTDYHYQYTDGYVNYKYNSYALDSGLTDSLVFVTTKDDIYHNSMSILDSNKYASTNPEWYAYFDMDHVNPDFNSIIYSLSNPGISKQYGQLCYNARGNTSQYDLMVQTAAQNIKDYVYSDDNRKSQPFKTSIMFGCQDNKQYCECATCKAKASEYGSRTGSVIHFLNDVVEEINDSAITVTFFAYNNFSNVPLKSGAATITADDQVAVMYAPISSNFNYSVGDATHNAVVKQGIDDWDKVVSNKYLWLYQTNYSNYLYPFDSYEASVQSIQYLKDKNAKMVYIEGQHNVKLTSRTGFDSLKQYLDGKFLINPSSNKDYLIANYFKNYYGKGSTYMYAFYKELRNEFAIKRNSLPSICTGQIYENISSTSVWSKEILTRWNNYCKTAYDLADGDSVSQSHILAESIFPRFALVTLYPSTYSSSDLFNMRSSFKTDATALGFEITKESGNNKLSDLYTSWGV